MPHAAQPRSTHEATASVANVAARWAIVGILLASAGCAMRQPDGGHASPSATARSPARPSADADLAAWTARLPGLGVSPQHAAGGGAILVELPSDHAFASGSAELTPAMQQSLARFATAFNRAEASAWQLRIVGNADSVGDEAENDALSLERARRAAAQLEALGVDRRRVQVAALGERQPQASNARRYGRELNRRIDLVLFRALAPGDVAGAP